MDASDFVVESLVIHDVPRPHEDGESEPILSDVCTPLNARLRAYFESKVRTSLDHAGRQIAEADPVSVTNEDGTVQTEPVSPVSGLLADFLNGDHTDERLVPVSKEIATHLSTQQTRSMSSGLLVVIRGQAEGRDAIALLKVEREEGLFLEIQEVDGNNVMTVEHLNDIMMGEKTRVYKAAVFGIRAQKLAGVASDEQAGPSSLGAVAAYFLHGFLGCVYAEKSADLTRRFFRLTESFLTQRTATVHRGGHLHSLLVEMQSASPSINAANFAQNYLPDDLADDFVNEVRDEGIPTDGFQKDPSLIGNRISKILWETESGVRIVAPSAEYGQELDVTQDELGNITISVKGRIRRITPR